MNTYSNPRQSLGFLLHQSAINWRRALSTELRSIDLTPVQFFMLGSTSRLTRSTGQAPMQKDVVNNTGVDVNVVSQVVRQLERHGLIVRQRDGADSRAYRLALTDTGNAKLHQAIAIVHAVDTIFFTDSNAESLIYELEKLA